MSKINFLLTMSIQFQEIRLPERKCFDLLSDSLNSYQISLENLYVYIGVSRIKTAIEYGSKELPEDSVSERG